MAYLRPPRVHRARPATWAAHRGHRGRSLRCDRRAGTEPGEATEPPWLVLTMLVVGLLALFVLIFGGPRP